MLSRDQNINRKNIHFFNSLSSELRFIQTVLDVNHVNLVIDSLQKGTLQIDGYSYAISKQEANYLQENLKTDTLHSEWA